MHRPPLFVVDAFAEKPFGGNPAAVCLLDGVREDGWLQSVASELNLSETAFVSKRWDGFGLRWFTPVSEVRLCGHATLAAAHVLWSTGRLSPDEPARFHTLTGLLVADMVDDGVRVDLPAIEMEPREMPAALVEALGVQPVATAVTADPGRFDRDWLVELQTERAVREAAPAFGALRREPSGFIVTARSLRDETAIVSRYFAPAWGIDEDPATGAAHCALGPYWMPRLGATRFPAFQASSRGARLLVDVEQPGRVMLSGSAVTIVRGELCV